MNESTVQANGQAEPKRLAFLPDAAGRIGELRTEVAGLRMEVEKLTARLTPTRFELAIEWARWLGLIIAFCYIIARVAL